MFCVFFGSDWEIGVSTAGRWGEPGRGIFRLHLPGTGGLLPGMNEVLVTSEASPNSGLLDQPKVPFKDSLSVPCGPRVWGGEGSPVPALREPRICSKFHVWTWLCPWPPICVTLGKFPHLCEWQPSHLRRTGNTTSLKGLLGE